MPKEIFMNERVISLAKLSRERDLYESAIKVEYDPMDLALTEPMFNAKRIIEYILAQKVYITEDNRYTGMLRFRGDVGVPADLFHRIGHKRFSEAMKNFYAPNYIDNLVVFEWIHSSPDYAYIIENGIEGSLGKIAYYKEQYRFDKERYEYLEGVEHVCRGLIKWSEKCARAHEDAALDCTDEKRRAELLKLAEICRRVPRTPAKTFYEGLQAIIFCFQFLPDSVGTIDRTLLKLYEKDIKEGVITREEAKDLMGEFLVHLSNHTPPTNVHANRTAECHFAIGGYTDRGEDGFSDLSRLIVEALMELDIRRPSISLRWTKKTPFEVLKFMLECERNDKNKRFAFVNDEPRIKAFMNICGYNFSDAVRYTMCGCNEPAFPGAVFMAGLTFNVARSLTNALYNRSEELVSCKTFEEFYAIYREELKKELDIVLDYHDKFCDMRAKDINVLSAFLLEGCIESAKSPTRHGCKNAFGGIDAMGITCVIDSLSMIKQFVFDEKRTDMAHLIETLKNNWRNDPDLRTEILKKGRFFGNNDPLSDEISCLFTTELYNITKDRKLRNGANILFGTLAGYNPHHMVYAAQTAATPDGRYDGDGFMVGIGQSSGKDRKGLLPLMRSVAQMDPCGILCGAFVCNMMIDGALMKNDEYFDKVCLMMEEYFRLGGLQVQLNYVTREELLEARKAPENYRSLKVRVSGYSDNFVDLAEQHQIEILDRTVQS